MKTLRVEHTVSSLDTSWRHRMHKLPSGFLKRCTCDIHICQERLWLPVAKARHCFVFCGVSATAKMRVTYVAFAALAGRLSANLVWHLTLCNDLNKVWGGSRTISWLLSQKRSTPSRMAVRRSVQKKGWLIFYWGFMVTWQGEGYMKRGKEEQSVLSCWEGRRVAWLTELSTGFG